MKIISIYNSSQYEGLCQLWHTQGARLMPAEELLKPTDITELDILVYHDTQTQEVLGFVCINNENRIVTVAAKPGAGRIHIWTQLIKEAKKLYNPLHLKVPVNQRIAFHFYTSAGFLLDGATLNRATDTVEYTMIYESSDF